VADSTKPDPLGSELENRLNELFSEEGPPPSSPAPAAPKRKDNNGPLAELKKIVLSIDWEITPEAVDGFLEQIARLKDVYRRDKTSTLLLQILGTLGLYIKSSRTNVHPSTFPLLNSVFARLDEIVANPGMSEAARRKLLQAEVEAYQDLRGKIARRRAPDPPPRPPAGTRAASEAPRGDVVTPAMLTQAVQELKAYIRSEIEALRRELRSGSRAR
jgi:hypothetical protein